MPKRNRKARKTDAVTPHLAPPPEQIGAFTLSSALTDDRNRINRVYRRLPVIDRLHGSKILNDDEYKSLAYYREQAITADSSPVRSNCDFSPHGGGHGPSLAVISAGIETARIEQDMGALFSIARAVAVENMTLEEWCASRFGARERYAGDGTFIAVVAINEQQHVKRARIDLRHAAHRITIR